jgi:hypothetical protein
MEPENPTLFDPSTKPAPDSFLGNKYLDPDYLFQHEVRVSKGFWGFITDDSTIATYHTLLYMFAIFFITVIIYSIVRLFEIRKKEHEHVHHEIEEYAHKHKEKQQAQIADEAISKNPRWRQVLQLLFSTSPNDWKLSVMEADAMLDILLSDLGFQGESMGEKLKIAGNQGFRHLNTAWEVHSIRNRIAHEGSIFEISHHEAKRVIALYESIFRDFGFI